jgi:leader peptidase (prepilin peptidase)/N-methyltransferase
MSDLLQTLLDFEVLRWVAPVFGAAVGSFLNVVIWRLPRGESLVRPGSHCPGCGAPIRGYDNIPILSWLVLRGRCRSCRGRISVRYPLIELLTALLCLGLFYRFGPSWSFLAYFVFAAGLLAASAIDLEHRIIPDELSLGGIGLGLAVSWLPRATVRPLDSLLAAGIGFLALFLVIAGYWLATRREGMGLGDAKLLAAIGAFLGWRAIPFVLFAGSLCGVIGGLAMIGWHRQGRFYKIPFGPFLSLGAWLWLFLSPELKHSIFLIPGVGG